MSYDAFNISTESKSKQLNSWIRKYEDLLVCEEEEDSIDCRKHPASDESEDDSGAGHDGVVLEGRGDVQEPVQSQYTGAGHGDQDNPEPDSNLNVTLPVSVPDVVSRLIAEIDDYNHHNGQGEVGHRLVEDEDEDGLAVDPGLVDGGQGGDDHQQVQEGLGDELDDGHDVEVWPDHLTCSY